MKYLIAVDDCYIDRPAGMGRVAWDIGRLMRDAGHHVAMFAAKPLNATMESGWSESQGIRILRYDRPKIARLDPFRMRKAIRAARRAAETLRTESWDLVHSHTLYTGSAAFEALAGRQPLVATVHSPVAMEQEINWADDGFLGQLKIRFGTASLNRLEKRLLAQTNGIHVLSQYTRRQLIRLHDLGQDAAIIPHWRRPELQRTHNKAEARARLGWPTDLPLLFTVRGHKPRIGIAHAIRAIGPLTKERRCRFMIGGDGPLRPYHEKLASELGFSEGIQFLGRLSDENLVLAYEAADCFILPTLSLECFGIIIVEALAFGCPVISTDAAAIPEAMEPILPNCIVPAGDERSLRDKVAEFLDERLELPDADALIRYVKERYDEHVVGPMICNFLETTAATGRPTRDISGTAGARGESSVSS